MRTEKKDQCFSSHHVDSMVCSLRLPTKLVNKIDADAREYKITRNTAITAILEQFYSSG